MDRDPYKTKVGRKLLELTKDLGMSVVAEGVETEEQWRWLLAHEADFVQRYFFGKAAFPPVLEPAYA